MMLRQPIFLIYNSITKKYADQLKGGLPIRHSYNRDDLSLSPEMLSEMTELAVSDYFYVVVVDKKLEFDSFNFTYSPPDWEKEYIHVWNGDRTVRLFNTDYTAENYQILDDQSWLHGKVRIKDHQEKIYKDPYFDIIFLSYDEEFADQNFENLQKRFPRAKRLSNIKGIFEAHRSAAELANQNKSDMFFVVDADAEILPDFSFDYLPPPVLLNTVHVWHARNPVNDLEYGYGGIKLFPTQKLLNYQGSPIDFTTSISSSLKVIPEVANITKFNTDPFSAWRSGFREAAKLASKIIPNQNNYETERRLDIWCTIGEDREFGDFVIAGAKDGKEFGIKYKNDSRMLEKINDYDWLAERFDQQ